jgi:ABC-type transport system involved in cytochrome c biogenesis ATPase subunit
VGQFEISECKKNEHVGSENADEKNLVWSNLMCFNNGVKTTRTLEPVDKRLAWESSMSLISLRLRNFTAFSELDIGFSPGLNVIIGENATGKSHLLKLCYTLAHVLQKSRNFDKESGKFKIIINKNWFQPRIAEKLVGVFNPDTLGRLCRRGVGRARSEINADFGHDKKLSFSFASNSKTDVIIEHIPGGGRRDVPIFFPPREVLSLFPGFISLYEERELSIDETYYDLCKLLSLPLLKGKRAEEIAALVEPLEKIMGGCVRRHGSRFYLHLPRQGIMEVPLIAEGLRKVAMLAYLAANGSLTDKSMLFWDEPEANLNPRIVRQLCRTLIDLVNKGVQVFLATHDLFVMKELSFLIEKSEKKTPARFFGLSFEEDEVKMERGELLEDIGTIVALQEILKQDDEEQDFYIKAME